MMEPLLPRLRQFSPQTKTKSARANIALLTLIWFAITAGGASAIVRATTHINSRARLQTHADSIALVAADRGDAAAREFAAHLTVVIVELQRNGSVVTITVADSGLVAESSALRPS